MRVVRSYVRRFRPHIKKQHFSVAGTGRYGLLFETDLKGEEDIEQVNVYYYSALGSLYRRVKPKEDKLIPNHRTKHCMVELLAAQYR